MTIPTPTDTIRSAIAQAQWDHRLSDGDVAALLRGLAVEYEAKSKMKSSR